MMHIEFLVEEKSAEAFLTEMVPKITEDMISFRIIRFRGKHDLLKKLPPRLKGYQKWLPDDYVIIVLIDRDRDDCRILKNRLERYADDAGLITKTMARHGESFQVINRIAVEEIEAWYFGDTNAINKAYPRIPSSVRHKSHYRNPDSVTGGTWEHLEALFKKFGYYRTGIRKIEVAERISSGMDPEHNRSHSFQVFRDALKELIA